MARLYREAPLNSVWEGTANMMCMDVRRAMSRDGRTTDAFFDELAAVAGMDARLDRYVDALKPLVTAALDDEFLARPLTEALARALQGAELVRHATTDVVDAFMATRIAPMTAGWGSMFGTLGRGVDRETAVRIVKRAHVGR